MYIGKAKETVLIIPDTQLPFDHKDSIKFLTAMKKKFKPTRVVHIGDFFDLHALSQYTHDPDGMAAGREIKKAVKKAKAYYKLFPKCDLIIGNHDRRIAKKAQDAGIPTSMLQPYANWLQTPVGWNIHDPKVEIDGILYIHGEGFSGPAGHRMAAIKNMQSVVIGHIHSNAGIAYIASHRALNFGMNVGCLVDNDAYAFAYGKHMPNKPILGAGVVVKGVPHYIPMLLNKSGKWVGSL